MEKKKNKHPLHTLKWVHRDTLKANNYNPNNVAPDEMDLLEISILEDGWTQPIVTDDNNVIVDGFHRWTISGRKAVMKRDKGIVPIVTLKAKNRTDKQMSTIRHNRARGVHAVQEMSNIVDDMIKQGCGAAEIMQRLKMSKDEVTRLMFNKGIPKSEIFKGLEFSKAWEPKKD